MRIPALLLPAVALLTAAAEPAPPPAPPPPAATSATPLDGVWRNTRNTVHIRAARCGQAICGTVVSAIAQARQDTRRGTGRDLIGLQIFRDFRPVDAAVWKGKIYIPDMASNASGRIQLTDRNSITVSGCMFMGLACKTQHWKRISS